MAFADVLTVVLQGAGFGNQATPGQQSSPQIPAGLGNTTNQGVGNSALGYGPGARPASSLDPFNQGAQNLGAGLANTASGLGQSLRGAGSGAVNATSLTNTALGMGGGLTNTLGQGAMAGLGAGGVAVMGTALAGVAAFTYMLKEATTGLDHMAKNLSKYSGMASAAQANANYKQTTFDIESARGSEKEMTDWINTQSEISLILQEMYRDILKPLFPLVNKIASAISESLKVINTISEWTVEPILTGLSNSAVSLLELARLLFAPLISVIEGIKAYLIKKGYMDAQAEKPTLQQELEMLLDPTFQSINRGNRGAFPQGFNPNA